MRKIIDRPFDQRAAIVDRDDLHAVGQSGLEFGELCAYAPDGLQRVAAGAHHDNAAGDLPFPVEVRRSPAELRAKLYLGDILDSYGRTSLVDADRNALYVGNRAYIAATTNHVLGLSHLDEAPADVAVRSHDCIADLAQGNLIPEQCIRVDLDLVLPDESTDRRDFGDTGHGLQRIAEIPVLQGTEFGEIMAAAPVHQGVLVDPANAGRIRPEGRRDVVGYPVADVVQVLQDSRPRPVQVGAILEDDINEREAEKRIAPHDLRSRNGQHRRSQRVGHLVLDNLRTLARVLGIYDDLHVGEVGDRVEGRRSYCVGTDGNQHAGQGEHQEAIAQRAGDDFFNHRPAPASSGPLRAVSTQSRSGTGRKRRPRRPAATRCGSRCSRRRSARSLPGVARIYRHPVR